MDTENIDATELRNRKPSLNGNAEAVDTYQLGNINMYHDEPGPSGASTTERRQSAGPSFVLDKDDPARVTSTSRRSSSAAEPGRLPTTASHRSSLCLPPGERGSTTILPSTESQTRSVITPAGSIFTPNTVIHTLFRINNFRVIWMADGDEIIHTNGHRIGALVTWLRLTWFLLMVLAHVLTAVAAYLIYNIDAVLGRNDEEVFETFFWWRKEGLGGRVLPVDTSPEVAVSLIQLMKRLAPFYSLFLVYVCGRFCLKIKSYYKGMWVEVGAPPGREDVNESEGGTTYYTTVSTQ